MAEDKPATFEQSLRRIEEIVEALEADDVELQRAVALYQEGQQLIKRCEEMLNDAAEVLRKAGTAGGESALSQASPAGSTNGEDLEDEIPF